MLQIGNPSHCLEAEDRVQQRAEQPFAATWNLPLNGDYPQKLDIDWRFPELSRRWIQQMSIGRGFTRISLLVARG